MGKVASKIANTRALVRLAAQVALARIAEEAEETCRVISHDHWKDDTGSARASITGWNPKLQSFDKNFKDPTWLAAQNGSVVSRYPWNFKDNYEPQVLTDERESDYEAYLSMFVKYAAAIESNSVSQQPEPVKTRTPREGTTMPPSEDGTSAWNAFEDTMAAMKGRMMHHLGQEIGAIFH